MKNGYKIKEKLRKGVFGIEYLAEKDDELYTLKKIKMKLKQAETEQCKNIINILSKINNEYLIKYYEAFMENDNFNIVMEYGGDMNLKAFIKYYKHNIELIDEDIIINIILQICEGLKEIHNNKIIYSNLTPDNIFIDKNNKIKIGDFGISKISTILNKYTKTKVGKDNYAAPEILKGTEYNNKVDIYSLGCIIYELFTLNEYYIDKKLDNDDCKINTKKYNPKFQELIDLLLKKDYHERPNIEEVIDYINKNINYIIAEINIKEKDINKDIRIINTFEEYIRSKKLNMKKDKIDEFGNEKEIKDNCKIKINNSYINFNYFYKFKEKGKYIIKYIFTNNITKTNHMFRECESLTNIDLSNFNSQNVISMSSMFSWCESLTNINLSNLNTQNVKNMSWMFYGCKSLINIDLSNFNTQNVKYMNKMFCGCNSLENINLSNFNTQNVMNMSWMFCRCNSLTNIDLSNFNTQNVTDMSNMFFWCSSLTYIDLSNFNTQYVIYMSWMFCECELLKNIDLSKFNTQNVINMREMFSGCKSLTNLNISNFNTQNVYYMKKMFSGCKALIHINLSNFNTLNVCDMSGMFRECESLKNIDLSNFNTQTVTDMNEMFYGCKSLTKINLSNFKTQNVKYMSWIFYGCYSLKIESVFTKDKRILEKFK